MLRAPPSSPRLTAGQEGGGFPGPRSTAWLQTPACRKQPPPPSHSAGPVPPMPGLALRSAPLRVADSRPLTPHCHCRGTSGLPATAAHWPGLAPAPHSDPYPHSVTGRQAMFDFLIGAHLVSSGTAVSPEPRLVSCPPTASERSTHNRCSKGVGSHSRGSSFQKFITKS